MKAFEIQAIANQAVVDFMQDGYQIEFMNKIHRNDSVILFKRNGSVMDVRMVKMEEGNEFSINDNYDLDTYAVNVYEYNGLPCSFSGVLWENRADNVVELAKLYTSDRYDRNAWYTSKEEAIERQRKHHERVCSRGASNTKSIEAEKMSDELLNRIRSIRGLKRASRDNITIEKRNNTYFIYFDFTKYSSPVRHLVIDAKHGLRTN